MPRTVFLVFTVLLAPQQDGATDTKSRSPGRIAIHDPHHATPLWLPLSDAARHLTSVLSFPEPVTRALVPWNEEDISIDTDGSEVMLKLLKPVEGDIAFRGRSGALYRFHVRPAKDGGDSFVKIVRAEEKETKSPPRSGALDLIRAMRLGRVPADVHVARAAEAALFESATFTVRPRFVYSTDRYRGYVVELANRSKDEPYRIDLARFTGKRLLLVGAKDLLVPPGGSTRLYLVFWR